MKRRKVMAEEGQNKSGGNSLDCTWIEEILMKRGSGYSSIACVATSDPVRALQLKAYLAMCGDYATSEIYYFSPWKGLEHLNRGQKGHLYFEPVKQQAGEYAQMAGVENQVLDLHAALRYMDGMLKQHRCVLIMEHLDEPRAEDKERHLIYAIRDWAHDREIICGLTPIVAAILYVVVAVAISILMVVAVFSVLAAALSGGK
jgi:hypothetical protein